MAVELITLGTPAARLAEAEKENRELKMGGWGLLIVTGFTISVAMLLAAKGPGGASHATRPAAAARPAPE